MKVVVIKGAEAAVKYAVPVAKKVGSKVVAFTKSPVGQEMAMNVWRATLERKESRTAFDQLIERLEECETLEDFQMLREVMRQLNQGRQKTDVVAS